MQTLNIHGNLVRFNRPAADSNVGQIQVNGLAVLDFTVQPGFSLGSEVWQVEGVEGAMVLKQLGDAEWSSAQGASHRDPIWALTLCLTA